MASKFGFIGPEVAEKLTSQIAELEVEAANQRAAILGLEDTVDGLLRVRDSGASDITVPTQSESVTEPETEEVTPQEEFVYFGDPIPEDTEFTITDGNSETNDNVSESGSAGISDDDGLASWAELSI